MESIDNKNNQNAIEDIASRYSIMCNILRDIPDDKIIVYMMKTNKS